MESRRTFLAAVPVAAAAATAGCLGFVTGDEPMTFESEMAAPTEAALSETGYEETEGDWQTESQTIEAIGVEREIEITYWAALYSKQVELQGQRREAAAFAVGSLPSAEVLGESRNPIADMDNREVLKELLGTVDGNYGNLRDIQYENTKAVPVLGEDRDVDVFSATGEIGGQEIELRLHVTVVEDGDDLILLLGGHPRLLPDEEVNLETLLESVEHPA